MIASSFAHCAAKAERWFPTIYVITDGFLKSVTCITGLGEFPLQGARRKYR